jgi:hypothetical protein
MNEPRDTLVGDALRRLDVPDHAPDFWSRLDAELAGTAHDGDGGDADADVVALAAAPSRPGATWARRPVLLAAAALVIVALAVGASVLRSGDDDESQLDVAETPGEVDADPEATEPPAPDTTQPPEATEPPETTSTTVPEAIDAAQAEEVAATWLGSLFDGDVDGAYDQLDLASRSLLDRDGFQELSSGLAEGAAAFSRPGITRAVTVLDAADASFAVVTFTGDVEREGMIETASYPVVVTASGVHFTLDGPQVELDPDYARSSGTTLAPPLEVLVSDTADTWLWVDGDEPERFLAGGRLVLGEEAMGGAGTHLVTIVAIEGGAITARSYTVVVP